MLTLVYDIDRIGINEEGLGSTREVIRGAGQGQRPLDFSASVVEDRSPAAHGLRIFCGQFCVSQHTLRLAANQAGFGSEDGKEMVAAVSKFALIDDGVLDAEDPDTLDLEQALRWVQTYAQLLALSVMVQAEHRSQIGGLTRQAEMYSRRLAFWKERSKAIADRYP